MQWREASHWSHFFPRIATLAPAGRYNRSPSSITRKPKPARGASGGVSGGDSKHRAASRVQRCPSADEQLHCGIQTCSL